MKTSGFLGLPQQIQELILQELNTEVKVAKAKLREGEQARPVDIDALASLRGDVDRVESLRKRLTSGQA